MTWYPIKSETTIKKTIKKVAAFENITSKKAKTIPTSGKVICSVVLYAEDVIIEKYLPKDKTITEHKYAALCFIYGMNLRQKGVE